MAALSWTDRYAHARQLLDSLALLEGYERVNDVEFSALVALNMDPPRAEPFSKATVHYWGQGRFQPEQDAVIGIARTCGVDPGWLTFGDATTALAPPGWKEAAADAGTARPSPATVRRLHATLRVIRGGRNGQPLPDVPLLKGLADGAVTKTRRTSKKR